MIFVSVGTLNRPFDRLIEGVDSIVDKLGEDVLIQTGYSTYMPRNCLHFKFCSHNEMLSHVKDSSIVISHAGFGIIGNSIKLQKPMILVPREFKLGEAIDRQYELAAYLADSNESIICVRDVSRLYDAVKSLRDIPVSYNYKTVIPELIEDFISRVFPGAK